MYNRKICKYFSNFFPHFVLNLTHLGNTKKEFIVGILNFKFNTIKTKKIGFIFNKKMYSYAKYLILKYSVDNTYSTNIYSVI